MKTKKLLATFAGVFALSAAGMSMGSIASAGASGNYPVGEIDFGSAGPTCIGDFPYITYDISAVDSIGDPIDQNDLTATITILDVNGKEVDKLVDQPLNGEILWPGASLDPPDWPGWEQRNGFWVVDETDEVLREPLTLVAEVNPTATATVEYPAADSECADPEIIPPPPTTTTTIAGILPPTGSSGVGQSLMIGATIAIAGVGLVLVAQRRRQHAHAPA